MTAANDPHRASEPVGECRVAEPAASSSSSPSALALEYANPRTAPPAPLGHFIFAAILFGVAHWLADCLLYLAVGDAHSPGIDWRRQLASPTYRYWQFYELGLTAVMVLIAFGVQWAAWRVRPVLQSRRVGFVAVLLGWAYCAASWGMYETSMHRPFSSEQVQVATKCVLAAIAGGVLACWRAGGAARRAGG